MSIEDKDRDDVMERLLELGGDKKYLTFDDLNRELPDNVVSPDDIEDVLQKLEGSNIPVADSDERLLEQAVTLRRIVAAVGRPFVSERFEELRGIEPAPLRDQKNRRSGKCRGDQNLFECHLNVARYAVTSCISLSLRIPGSFL